MTEALGYYIDVDIRGLWGFFDKNSGGKKIDSGIPVDIFYKIIPGGKKIFSTYNLDKNIKINKAQDFFEEDCRLKAKKERSAFHILNSMPNDPALAHWLKPKHLLNLVDSYYGLFKSQNSDDILCLHLFALANAKSKLDKEDSVSKEAFDGAIDYVLSELVRNASLTKEVQSINPKVKLEKTLFKLLPINGNQALNNELTKILRVVSNPALFASAVQAGQNFEFEERTNGSSPSFENDFSQANYEIQASLNERKKYESLLDSATKISSNHIRSKHHGQKPTNNFENLVSAQLKASNHPNIQIRFSGSNDIGIECAMQRAKSFPEIIETLAKQGYDKLVLDRSLTEFEFYELKERMIALTDFSYDQLFNELERFFKLENRKECFLNFAGLSSQEKSALLNDEEAKPLIQLLNNLKSVCMRTGLELSFKDYADYDFNQKNTIFMKQYQKEGERNPLEKGTFDLVLSFVAFNPYEKVLDLEKVQEDLEPSPEDNKTAIYQTFPVVARKLILENEGAIEEGMSFTIKDFKGLPKKISDDIESNSDFSFCDILDENEADMLNLVFFEEVDDDDDDEFEDVPALDPSNRWTLT
jgi:hypothetical protein